MNMVKKHLKRINAPKTWPIERKKTVFITQPNPGPHSYEMSVPLVVLFKEMLNIAKTTRTVRYILNTQEVIINGHRRRRPEDIVGLFDVVSFPATKTSYRIVINKLNTLVALPIAGKDATTIPSKIISKTLMKGGKLQLGFHNGETLLTKETKYKVGDTLFLTLEKKEGGHFPLETGAFVLVTSGKHVGTTGTVEVDKDGLLSVKCSEGTIETKKENLFVVGKGKATIKIE